MKRSLSFFLTALVMTACVFLFCGTGAVEANAADYSGECGADGDNLTWTLDTSTGVLEISGSGDMKDYSFDSDDNKAPWDSYKTSIKTIVLHDGVTSIGNYAFYNLKYMTSVSISESVTKIRGNAFRSCERLTSISIPSKVTSIGGCAFYNCTGLTSIYYNAANVSDKTDENYIFSDAGKSGEGIKVTIGKDVERIPDYLFCPDYWEGTVYPDITEVVFEEDGVCKSIGDHSFAGCKKLTRVSIGDSVTSIDSFAFYGTSITRVDITDIAAWCNIEFAGETSNPLSYAKNLYLNGTLVTDLTIPDSVTSIGNYAFYNFTSLESISIPDGVTSIGGSAFSGCTNLTSISIPDSVTSIGGYAFNNCTKLTSVYYCGTADRWNLTNIGKNNSYLTDAKRYYHDYSEWYVLSDSRCEVAGVEERICSICSDHDTREIPALSHIKISHEAKEPTCTETGWNVYVTCTRCDYTTYAEISALGHYEITHGSKTPTCTDIGWDAYVTCTRCDHTTYAEKSALGHDEIEHEAKAPACTEIGWNAYVTCSRCDYTTYTEIPALGHEYETFEGKAPTCTEIGWNEYYECLECGEGNYAGLPALGHSWGDWNCVIAPTCTKSGLERRVCSACSKQENRMAAPAHKWGEWQIVIDAYCSEEGSETRACSVCSESEERIIPALDHDDTVYEGKAPTCTEGGWVEYVICARCERSTYETLDALGHDEISHEAQAPTCTEMGYEAYVTCSRCDYTTYKELSALGHDEIKHEAQAPTCTEIGWDVYATCSRCEHSTYIEIPALGHDDTVYEGKAPTCTEAGYAEYSICVRCERSTYADLDALGHSYEKWEVLVEPEDGGEGFRSRLCSACGDEEFEMISYAKGDVDGDGVLSNSDMTIAVRALAGWDADYNFLDTDVNYDGVITNRDIIALVQRLAGWN